MGTEWIDEAPYPGPAFRTVQEELDEFTHAFSSWGRGVSGSYGTMVHKIAEAFRKADETAQKAVLATEDRDWSLVPPVYKTPKPPNHYGPRPKRNFDRRGRKTF